MKVAGALGGSVNLWGRYRGSGAGVNQGCMLADILRQSGRGK